MGIYVICKENSNSVQAAFTNVQPEQMVPEGIQTEEESIPRPEDIPGLSPVLMLNKVDNTLYYDYIAPDTVVSRLQKANAELNLTIGNLVLESANDKATIASLESTVGSLLLEVAALKGGAE